MFPFPPPQLRKEAESFMIEKKISKTCEAIQFLHWKNWGGSVVAKCHLLETVNMEAHKLFQIKAHKPLLLVFLISKKNKKMIY